MMNTSSASWDNEYAQAANLSPELLAEALASPGNPVAHYVVAELTGVEDPSPTFVVETITALKQARSEAATPRRSQAAHVVEVLQHQPGVNDLMSGAVVNPAVQSLRTAEQLARLTIDDNDSTVCIYQFPIMAELMPYKLFNSRDIVALGILHDPANIKYLPFEFHTTTLGLKNVWDEVFQGQEQAAYDDEDLLTALLKVGGVPPRPGMSRGVLYPEDLVPCTGKDEWDEEQCVYWTLLRDLKETSLEDEEAEDEAELTQGTEHDEDLIE